MLIHLFKKIKNMLYIYLKFQSLQLHKEKVHFN